MHELFLMRHAKAEDTYRGSDHARQLTERGRRQAHAAGALLRTEGIALVLTSSAARTQQTAEGLGLDCPIVVSDDLYDCGTGTMRRLVAETPEEVGSLLVVAHSPATPAFAQQLTGPSPDLGWFPTAAFARFRLSGRWRDLSADEVSEDDDDDEGIEFVAIHRGD